MSDYIRINPNMQYYRVLCIFDRTITTIVTDSDQLIDWWILSIKKGPRLIGLGLQLADAGRVGTIQFCMGGRCLICVVAASLPQNLKAFLVDPDNIFVGFGLHSKLEILDQYVRYLDLGILANRIEEVRGPASSDLTTLATHVLENVDVVWPQPVGRWDSWKLSLEEAGYACVHPYVSLQMARLLLFGRLPEKFVIRVMREEGPMKHIHEVQIFNRTITTTVTNRATAVDDWISDVAKGGHLIVGFDVELCSFNNRPHIATVQFCIGSRCLVIQFVRMTGRYLPELEDFLLHGDNRFVGVGIMRKMRLLTDWLLFFRKGRAKGVDAGVFASRARRLQELEIASAQELVGRLFGVDLWRPHRQSGWDRATLSDAQVEYACINAAASYEIGKRMLPVEAHFRL